MAALARLVRLFRETAKRADEFSNAQAPRQAKRYRYRGGSISVETSQDGVADQAPDVSRQATRGGFLFAPIIRSSWLVSLSR